MGDGRTDEGTPPRRKLASKWRAVGTHTHTVSNTVIIVWFDFCCCCCCYLTKDLYTFLFVGMESKCCSFLTLILQFSLSFEFPSCSANGEYQLCIHRILRICFAYFCASTTISSTCKNQIMILNKYLREWLVKWRTTSFFLVLVTVARNWQIHLSRIQEFSKSNCSFWSPPNIQIFFVFQFHKKLLH